MILSFKKISVVIPCYNSESSIELIVKEICNTIEGSELDYEIILVNDGSKDKTFSVLSDIAKHNSHVLAIDLAKNFGQHAAIIAGYAEATGDVIVGLDDDGEHSPKEMFKLITKLDEGYDFVCGNFDAHDDNMFRKLGSKINGKMAEILLSKPKDIEFNSYYAMRRYVVEEIIKYTNPYPYIIGIVLRITNNMAMVDIPHKQRIYGKSGYSIKKLFSLWLNGFTAFSVKPLRIATVIGVICSIFGFLFGIFIVVKKLIYPEVPIGYSSLMACILFMGGLLMLMLGLVGEYIGRTYINVSNVPQYVIRKKVSYNEKEKKL